MRTAARKLLGLAIALYELFVLGFVIVAVSLAAATELGVALNAWLSWGLRPTVGVWLWGWLLVFAAILMPGIIGKTTRVVFAQLGDYIREVTTELHHAVKAFRPMSDDEALVEYRWR